MNVTELKHDIQSGNIKSFYIFTGDEWKIQELYIKQIETVVGKKVYCDTVAEVISLLNRKLFSNQRTLYVVRDDKEFMTNEKAQKRVFELLSDNVLILAVSSPDKRMKFFKTYSKPFIAFMPLETAVLARYVKREIALSDRNIERLIELCENNYGRCLLEIDKIRCYYSMAEGDGYDMSWDEAFEHLVDTGVIYQPPYDAIFDFVTEVMKRHVNNSFNLLEQCYAVGESTLVLLSVLYTNTKQVLQVQSYKGNKLAEATGLTAWQIKQAKEKIGYRTIGELVYMLKLIRTVEKGIKTGQMEEEYAMQYLLANVL